MIIGDIGVCPLTHVGTSTSKESGPIHTYTILIYIDILSHRPCVCRVSDAFEIDKSVREGVKHSSGSDCAMSTHQLGMSAHQAEAPHEATNLVQRRGFEL